MSGPSHPGKPRTIVTLAGALGGFAVALYNYLTPLTGVTGTGTVARTASAPSDSRRARRRARSSSAVTPAAAYGSSSERCLSPSA